MVIRRKTNADNRSAMYVAVREFERVLRRRGESYQALVEAATDIIFALSAQDGRVIFLNPAFEKATGYARSEWIGKPFATLIHPDDRHYAIETLFRLVGGDSVPPVELRIRSKTGDYMVSEISAAPEIEDGKVVRVFGVARDITERKRVEEALRKSEEKYRTIIEHIEEGYYEVNLSGAFTFFNDSLCGVLGYRRDELLGMDHRQLADERTARRVYQAFNRVYLTGEPSKGYRCEITRKDRTKGIVEISISLIRDSEGRPSGFRGIVRDVALRALSEEALRESEARYKGLVDTAFDGVVIHQDGVFKAVNRAYAAMFGYTVEELVGRSVLDLTPPELRQSVATRMAEETESRYETVGLRKDGSYIDIEVSAKNSLNGGRPCRLTAVRDITEARRAEKALRASGERYRLLFERNLSGICRATLDGRILDCNDAFAGIFGYESRADVLATGTLGLYGNSIDRRNYLSRLKEHNSLNNLELLLKRKDGKPVWVLGNVSLVEDDEGELTVIEGIWMDITERKLTEVELQNSRELLRALSAELQVIREQERTHIARELHDLLGQTLTRLKIDLSLMADDLPEEGRHLLSRVSTMSKLFDATIQNVRRLCSELRPSALDHLGLAAAINEELLDWHNRTGIEYDFVSHPQDFMFDPELSTAVFRILQEALTNVARHASATRVDVRLTYKRGCINLRLTDNGSGISEDQVYNPKSLGLIGMRERALQWGARLDIGRGRRGGTVITLVFPRCRVIDGPGKQTANNKHLAPRNKN